MSKLLEEVKELYEIGDRVHISKTSDCPKLDCRDGIITRIVGIKIYGTWGREPIIYGEDDFFKTVK